MSVKHSDGPWGISSQSPRTIKQFDCLGESNVIIGSACGYTGSGFFPSDEEAIVNARIMGASLDLLEACNAFADHMSGLTAWTQEQEDALIEQVRAAIAKATGEPS